MFPPFPENQVMLNIQHFFFSAKKKDTPFPAAG
jgi:hypothetical protein